MADALGSWSTPDGGGKRMSLRGASQAGVVVVTEVITRVTATKPGSRFRTVDELLESKLNALPGRRIDAAETEAVLTALASAPPRVLDLMVTYAVAITKFTLDESDDESGLGIEMRWLKPEQIVDEAQSAFPGIAAASHHYLPVGACLFGTGDPYFIHGDAPDLTLFCIPHTAVTSAEGLLLDQIELVSASLDTFIAVSRAR